MECKFQFDLGTEETKVRFLLTMWNVNLFRFVEVFSPFFRFLLTMWNVNSTLSVTTIVCGVAFSINYVECKFAGRHPVCAGRLGFSINYVECKFHKCQR